MRKTDNTRIPLEALIFAVGIVVGVAVSVIGENRLVTGAGITQGTADAIYMKRDGSNDPDITGNLAATVAGIPLSLTNTTDQANNVLCEIYSNPGTGSDGDEIQIPVYFDDDSGGGKILGGVIVIKGDDLDAKGGAFTSFIWRTGSTTSPIDVIKIDGNTNTVQANFFSIDDQLFTGMTGSANQLDYKVNNLLAWQVTPTQFRFLTGRDMRVDDGIGIGNDLAVGLTLAALDASVMAEFASTTQGTIPWPKMTSAQRDAIGSPDEGSSVYDMTNNVPNFHNGTGYRAFIHAPAATLTVGSVPFTDGACSLTDDNANFAYNDGTDTLTIKHVELTGRLQGDKGADVASVDEIALGTDGNFFDITGTTTINHITKTGWQAGSIVVLQFDASVTVTHNAGSPAGTEASILLSGAGDFSATPDDTLQLVYDGTTWREVSRTVI